MNPTYFVDRRWRLLLAGLAIGLLMGTGCGDGRPKRVPVAGRVLIDGRPLAAGVIRVLPKGNRVASGTIGPDGRFRLTTFDVNDGCVTGKHPVVVDGSKSLSQTATQWLAPKKYANPGTSELTVEIGGPRDDVEIRVSWEGGKPFIEHFEPEPLPGGKK
jgi:hypothetical protein